MEGRWFFNSCLFQSVLNARIFMLVLIFFRMETTKMPLYLTSTQHFYVDQVTEKCKHLLPERDFNATNTLTEVLTQVFHCMEEDMRISVRDQMGVPLRNLQATVEHWLMQHSVTKKEYL